MILNKLNNLNLKTKIKVFTSLYALSIILIVYFYIIPSITVIKTIKAEIFTEKIEQEKKLNRERNYANLGSKIKEIKPRLDTLENVYINANRKLEFITTLEGIAADNGVEQKLNLNLKFNSDGTIKKVPLSIEINGTYLAVLNYLISIETISYYLNIDSFDLALSSSAKNEGSLERYNLHLNTNTYWK